ncbi:putative WD repeat-containing protein [Tolypocladium ophioglossoides CBS 100239]|uniref:Putative WD repeat-containing protein n=1 Tax=Tolypocladium ophioglossoides (strain CBS 100239) TaxID=1163406 RepID=A0A0L0NKL2_TOLOC|nr:putative WD repeat-containing protein [Tolypocladium ophioglossoides CBS 100239]
MQSSDRDHFFQTDASQARRERKTAKAGNKNGSPLEMKSKILAAIPDPAFPLSCVFIAESAGYARRVNLDSSEAKATYRGPKSPVTCLAIGGTGRKTIFAGSWDKDIWSWDVESAKPGRKYSGHSDFVKAVVCTRLFDKEVLVSGGADKKILVWDIETGRQIHTLQDPTTTMMAVQYLAIDPVLSTPDALVLASASSDPHIRRWKITLDSYEQLPDSFHDRPDTERLTIEEHDTSVYKLVFDVDGDEVDLWTASADGTAKCLARSRNFVADDVFTHGDYVRAVLVTEQWVMTAGRDENVKVWDRATGKLYCTLEGHFEEVTDLVMLRNAQGSPQKVCSVSIDRTIRTWPLARAELDDVVKKIQESQKPDPDETDKAGGDVLTAEEEAELEELMDD